MLDGFIGSGEPELALDALIYIADAHHDNETPLNTHFWSNAKRLAVHLAESNKSTTYSDTIADALQTIDNYFPAPFIVVQHGEPRVAEVLPDFQPNRLAVIAASWKEFHAFDRHSEYRQNIGDVPTFGKLAKLLARTVYNPRDNLEARWSVCGKYDEKRIAKLVDDGLTRDDDIIQQWYDARQIRKLLRAASSFDNMVLAVRCICGEHETNADAKQYADAVL